MNELNVRMFGVCVNIAESKSMKKALKLPFEILTDEDRSVLKEWEILNTKERKGISYPNVYVIDKDMEIVFHSRDTTPSRVASEPLLNFLKQHTESPELRTLNDKIVPLRPLISEVLLAPFRSLGWFKG